MAIRFEHKELEDYQQDNQSAWLERDREYPLERLDPFAFEDITYFTFKQVIRKEGDWDGYNEIELLGGIKDKG